YMSPEQVRNPKRVDTRTDIWGLGLVLHEMLTGVPVYDIDTFPMLCMAIVGNPPPRLREKRPDAPSGLEAVLLRCAQKDPAHRFASVVELALALAPYAPAEAAPLIARIMRRGGPGFVAPSPVDLAVDAVPAAETANGVTRAIVSPDAPAPAAAGPRRRTMVGLFLASTLTFGFGAAFAFQAGGVAMRARSTPATALAAAYTPPAAVPVVSVYDLPVAPAAAAAPLIVPTDAPAEGGDARPVAPKPADSGEAAAEAAPPARTAPAPLPAKKAHAGAPRAETGDELNDAALMNRR
ncbi:MAG TPA: protein kinase, partial [Polyangiaceae bacterium]|nr:protein kinase [Polyangiaceae bacterium]